jgi:hypothetical protein
MTEVVDFINDKGRALVTENRRSSIICGVGRSRGGGFGEQPGIAWCDFWMDLRTGEYLLNHKQIVGHTIQPRGIAQSRIGKLWGVNVHYDHAQALVYDHATDTFTPSIHMAPEDSAFFNDVQKGTKRNRQLEDAINRYDAGILEKAVNPPPPPPEIDWDDPHIQAFM